VKKGIRNKIWRTSSAYILTFRFIPKFIEKQVGKRNKLRKFARDTKRQKKNLDFKKGGVQMKKVRINYLKIMRNLSVLFLIYSLIIATIQINTIG